MKEQQQQEFPTFCYTNGTNTVNLAQLATTDDNNKTCFIQPFGYTNYALVNNFPNGIAGIATVDGRIQVVNKPLANTVSSISFKCDVCGAMFTQLAHLNQHKRLHTQDGGAGSDGNPSGASGGGSGSNNQADTITVVTSGGQNFIQGQNLISENGQGLAQIQIVTAESLEAAQHQQQPQQQQQQHHQDVAIVSNPLHGQSHHQQMTGAPTTVVQTTGKVNKGPKCGQCGGPRRRGSKGGRCEGCVKGDQAVQHPHQQQDPQQRATQIFVDPDGDVKFEVAEMDPDMIDQDIIEEEVVATQNAANALQMAGMDDHRIKIHPVKKRSATSVVSKCNRCNGTGLIYVEGSGGTICSASGTAGHGIIPSAGAGNSNRHVTNHPSAVSSGSGGMVKIKRDPGHDGEFLPPSEVKSDKPFFCNLCGGQFSRYSSLWSHRKLHTGEKNHKCSVCGLAFAKSVYLKNHMRIHTGEKPYLCKTCGMQFSQSPHLKNHERTHSGEKPYVCEVCDKGFARHATLWNHRRIHTGEKPYKCQICGSSFSQAAHLKNHAKVHSGEKPFKCDICSTAFADRFALKRHRGIHDKYGQTAPRNPLILKEEIISKDD